MDAKRVVVVVSAAPPLLLGDWAAQFEAHGCSTKVVEHFDCWVEFGRPVESIAFLLDGLSIDWGDYLGGLAIALHNQRPSPDAGLIVPAHDPSNFIKRFEDSHLWIHRHWVDDWAACVAHVAGVRRGSHVHAM